MVMKAKRQDVRTGISAGPLPWLLHLLTLCRQDRERLWQLTRVVLIARTE